MTKAARFFYPVTGGNVDTIKQVGLPMGTIVFGSYDDAYVESDTVFFMPDNTAACLDDLGNFRLTESVGPSEIGVHTRKLRGAELEEMLNRINQGDYE